MSGQHDPGVPPEVPEEFADAYRAAYLRALAAQTDAPRHVVPPPPPAADPGEPVEPRDAWAHELPERTGRLHRGTHREPEAAPERSLAQRSWFVPLLLGLIVLLLVAGAYALGRIVAATIGG